MSFIFDGTNDTITATLTSTYSKPCTLACWILLADHPGGVIDTALTIGNSSSSTDETHTLRIGNSGADNTFTACSQVTGGASSVAIATKTIDGVWTPFIGVFTSTASRDVYIGDQTANNTGSRAVTDTLKFLRMGENLAAGTDMVGRIAEASFWNVALSATEIANYLRGVDSRLVRAANLQWFIPMNTNSLANLGLDAGGAGTAVNQAAFDSAHPTIIRPALKSQMYY